MNDTLELARFQQQRTADFFWRTFKESLDQTGDPVKSVADTLAVLNDRKFPLPGVHVDNLPTKYGGPSKILVKAAWEHFHKEWTHHFKSKDH